MGTAVMARKVYRGKTVVTPNPYTALTMCQALLKELQAYEVDAIIISAYRAENRHREVKEFAGHDTVG